MSTSADPRGAKSRAQGNLIRDLLLEYIKDYTEREGWAPTNREMADAMDRSTEAIRLQLIKLAELGQIRLGDGPRAIKVLR